ncbi:MAG: DinB family protein [Ginsengibacter sp.]
MDNAAMQVLTEGIIKQLSDFYKGDPWVTDNLIDKVFSLGPDIAFKKVLGHSHSIAQQVAHIRAWRNFVVQKLTGNGNFDIKDNSLSDWLEPTDWRALSVEFETGHNNLLAAIKNFPVDQWHSTVPGRSYSFIYLISGIVEHDYYHFGQIGSILAAIKKM